MSQHPLITIGLGLVLLLAEIAFKVISTPIGWLLRLVGFKYRPNGDVYLGGRPVYEPSRGETPGQVIMTHLFEVVILVACLAVIVAWVLVMEVIMEGSFR